MKNTLVAKVLASFTHAQRWKDGAIKMGLMISEGMMRFCYGGGQAVLTGDSNENCPESTGRQAGMSLIVEIKMLSRRISDKLK